MNAGRIAIGLGVFLVGLVPLACSYDFDIGSGQQDVAIAPPASTASNDAGASPEASAPLPAPRDAGVTPAPRDAGTTTPKDAGTLPPRAGDDGAPCTMPTGDSDECRSGLCILQRGNRVRTALVCTVECNREGREDPLCDGVVFTGFCNFDGTCIVR
jgi:hypothetical protein